MHQGLQTAYWLPRTHFASVAEAAEAELAIGSTVHDAVANGRSEDGVRTVAVRSTARLTLKVVVGGVQKLVAELIVRRIGGGNVDRCEPCCTKDQRGC